MSTLKVNDITEATSGGAKFDVIRAWGIVKQTGTQSILDDQGVSSITDMAAGGTKFTFGTAFSGTSYCGAYGAEAFQSGGVPRALPFDGGYRVSGALQSVARTTSTITCGYDPNVIADGPKLQGMWTK